MGKYISGIVTCEIHFNNVYVENDENEIDTLFPNGWEGEMLSHSLIITEEHKEQL